MYPPRCPVYYSFVVGGLVNTTEASISKLTDLATWWTIGTSSVSVNQHQVYREVGISSEIEYFVAELVPEGNLVQFTAIRVDVEGMGVDFDKPGFQTQEPELHWRLAIEYQSKFEAHLLKCGNQLSDKRMWKTFHNSEDLVAHVLVSVWKELLGNHSYITDGNALPRKYMCRGVRKVPFPEIKNGYGFAFRFLQYQRVSIRDPDASLVVPELFSEFQFVSCGLAQEPPLAFTAFITSFDRFVWLFLLIALGGMLGAGKLLWRGEQRRMLLSYVKVLLEQGDPFLPRSLERLPGKLMIGTFMLMGIVLSNCYKNDNLSKVVSPRRPVLPTEARHLINNNFSIHSRLDPYSFAYLVLTPNSTLTDEIKVQCGFPGWFCFRIGKDSEALYQVFTVKETDRPCHGFVFSHVYKFDSVDKINLSERVCSNVKTMGGPLISYIVAQPNPSLSNWTYEKKDGWVKGRLHKWISEQETTFYNDLRKCNKTSVVQPSRVSQLFYRMLRNNKSSLHGDWVSIGEETYFGRDDQFRLYGSVPHKILRRVKKVKQSGILERWLRLISNFNLTRTQRDWEKNFRDASGNFSSSYEPEPEERTNMAGNILTVFYILLAGLGLAVLTFTFESGFLYAACLNLSFRTLTNLLFAGYSTALNRLNALRKYFKGVFMDKCRLARGKFYQSKLYQYANFNWLKNAINN